MPDYTVSGDVDSMLRSANDAAIRSAIGVGTTDAITAASFAASGTNSPRLFAFGDATNTRGFEFFTIGTRVCYREGSGTVLSIGLSSGLTMTSTTTIGWAGTSADGNADTILVRDGAAGILAQRNGSSTQAFRLYNTYTSVSDYQRLNLSFAGGVCQILSTGLGNSSHAPLTIGTGAGTWQFAVNGSFIALADNTYDIGASGANRPRNIFANSLAIGSFLSIASETGISPRTNTAGSGPVLVVETSTNWTAGVARFRDTRNGWSIFVPSVTDATIQVGGTTSLFPSLKRSTTYLQAKLADDSAFTNIQGKLTTDTAYTGTVVTPTGYLTLYDSTGTAYRVPCVV